jgi:hypothetical protein
VKEIAAEIYEYISYNYITTKRGNVIFRILKKGKMCAVMIGDVRKYSKVIPLGFRMMECFLQAGFVNEEIIIKEQHNYRSTKYWKNQNNKFLLLAHEYIFVFQK